MSSDVTDAPRTTGPGGAAAPRPPRSARRMFCATLLGLEALVVFFAALAAYGLRVVDTGVIVGVGLGGAALCIVAAGMLRSVVGYVLGTLVQVALLVAGVLLPQMRDHLLAVGVVFAVLWVVCWRVGGRIDVERAERYEAELAHARGEESATEPSTGADGAAR